MGWKSGIARTFLVAAWLIIQGRAVSASGWESYGGDPGGQRYVAAAQITPENVSRLKAAWRFSTGDMTSKPAALLKRSYAFETTPILVSGSLVFCTPFNEIIALDPASGALRWRFDPHIALDSKPANQFVCRGVSYWRDGSAPESALCSARVFMGTNDARLIAVDARTGHPCPGFGTDPAHPGEVAAGPDRALLWPGEFQITSAPLVAGDLIVTGSSIGDNARVDAPAGSVRAYDARTGKLVWSFDPLTPDKDSKPVHAGAANAWAPLSYDVKRDLIFIPTSSPSPDFFGGLRAGNDSYADSVVALEAKTGHVRWSFQTVHHDVWDYDLPAQPTLLTLTHEGREVDAVAQVTKTGFMFVLDRDTGKPVFGVEERPVPQGGALGEALSPTQPFPLKPPALVPQKLEKGDSFGVGWFDRRACNARLDGLRSEGLFTPPSEQGTILYPFTGGGANWGGMAYDPVRQIAIVNVSRLAHVITLFPAAEYKGRKEVDETSEISPQRGARFGMRRDLFTSPLGLPCSPPPWGALVAVDLKSGEIKWNETLGSLPVALPVELPFGWGSPSFGGPLVTQTGLVFLAATMDSRFRAFDIETGKVLWTAVLPAGGQATPMSYEWKGRQYVLIAAGGHARSGTALGDEIVAYALPE
ncbi:MAG: pyrroloquinoline quinone-dependent dehydrogenase [Parvibaculaceae bacterium]|nr:pyrroloquinoline quinone-dependent dehydrogenase [Parvibaculaceae bacterium]